MTKSPSLLIEKILLTACIFWLGTTAALCQEMRLKGKVVDNNGREIEGVKVVLQGADSTRVLVTVSSDEGLFTLNGLKAGKYNISFSSAGFENKTEKNVEVVADYENSILVRMYEKVKRKLKYDTQF